MVILMKPYPTLPFKLFVPYLGLAYGQISASQRGKLTDFKADLRDELTQNSSRLDSGLNYLKDYFKGDPSLRIEQERQLLEKIETAKNSMPLHEKVDTVATLILEVRTQDYPRVLRRFGCDGIMKAYFPQKISKSSTPNS